MNGRSAQLRMLTVVLAATALVACRKEAKEPTLGEKHDEAQDRWAIDSARMEADRIAAGAPTELSGSTWNLVHLRAAQDSVFTPSRVEVFSLEFGADGRVAVVAGCNNGTGTWTAMPPSGLKFGPLATTRAMCPPESMSARFLGDFGRMEAYQLVGGRLYIRLADNGGVYEFAPSTPDADLTGSGEPVVFRCVDSAGARVRLQVVFNKVKPASVTLMHKGKKATLPQVMSGSGARYEGPAGMFWNKGRAATVTWQGMQLTCTTMQE